MASQAAAFGHAQSIHMRTSRGLVHSHMGTHGRLADHDLRDCVCDYRVGPAQGGLSSLVAYISSVPQIISSATVRQCERRRVLIVLQNGLQMYCTNIEFAAWQLHHAMFDIVLYVVWWRSEVKEMVGKRETVGVMVDGVAVNKDWKEVYFSSRRRHARCAGVSETRRSV